MTNDERWLDELDRHLYTYMQQCPTEKKYQELYMALQSARGVSLRLLPQKRQNELREKVWGTNIPREI
jgi:hypothetical protein